MTSSRSTELLIAAVDATSAQAAGVAFRPKTVTRLFLLAVALMLVLQAAMNVALNPAGYFRDQGVLLSAVRSSDAYQKLEMLDRFLNAHSGQDVTIALGSSRIMMLSFDDSSSDQPFFNAGISGGHTEDVLAFSRYLARQGRAQVQSVIINVDPGVLGMAGADDYGQRLQGVHKLMSLMDDRSTRRKEVDDFVGSLLSIDWITAAAEAFSGYDPTEPDFDPTTGVRLESVFDRRLELADGDRHRLLHDHIDRFVASAKNTRQDPRRVADLQEAVRTLTEIGADVTLVIMPYHPLLLDESLSIPDYADQMAAARSLAEDLAQHDKVTVVDIADPRPLKLANDEYWWDGLHYTSAASSTIARAIERAGTEQHVASRPRILDEERAQPATQKPSDQPAMVD